MRQRSAIHFIAQTHSPALQRQATHAGSTGCTSEGNVSAGDQLLAPANCGSPSRYSSEKSILEERDLKTLNHRAESAFAFLVL